ncbi:MAG: isochorismatase family protein [Planctomycetaceae bacterium]|nr:isochorismatase family protein [Planctomycetaceae bacterium]
MTPSESPEPANRSTELLWRERSQLLVIDVQEKLLPVIHGSETLTQSIRFLLDCAMLLDVPVVVSEQYPNGLGPTVEALQTHQSLNSARRFDKLKFSAADGFCTVADDDRDQVLVVGIEAHICVLQTTLDLIARGFRVFVAADAVSSRRELDCRQALNRVRDAGGIVGSAEGFVFEWCETAGTDIFRELSRIVRRRDSTDH